MKTRSGVRVYFYLRAEGKTVGGPYRELRQLASAIRARRNVAADLSRMGSNSPIGSAEPTALVGGRWRALSPEEGEALRAHLEG